VFGAYANLDETLRYHFLMNPGRSLNAVIQKQEEIVLGFNLFLKQDKNLCKKSQTNQFKQILICEEFVFQIT